MESQPGILQGVPAQGRYLFFSLAREANVQAVLSSLSELVDGESVLVGIGQPLVELAGKSIEGLQCAPVFSGSGIAIPAMPYALWFWLRGSDRGVLVHKTLEIEAQLADNATLEDVIDAFMYGDSRDLSGYIDGTENPEAEAAIEAGFVNQGNLAGSSFVAVQKWLHDLPSFRQMSTAEQNNLIGRDVDSNEELDDAPLSAHVKRAAQETFSPEAYILRRSMPWADFSGEGLVFVAFGKSFAAFDAILTQMLGVNDNVVDNLFELSKCLGTSYFWCPPMLDGHLDLSAIG